MATMPIGGQVRATDGPVGTLTHVVVDRTTGDVSELVVQRSGGGALVLPMSLVRDWDPLGVRLNVPLEQMERERVYVAQDFRACDVVPAGVAADAAVSWECRYGADIRLQPAVAARLLSRSSGGAAQAIGRGTRVLAGDGPAGILDHILFDSETGEVSYLIVGHGDVLARPVVLPMDMVRTIDEEGVHVDATVDELLRLGPYSGRADDAIRLEVLHQLRPYERRVEGLDVSVAHGLVTVRGNVADAETRRAIDDAVRSVEGVVDYDDDLRLAPVTPPPAGRAGALTLDSAVANEIISALARDERTEGFGIEVVAEHGVVTLAGEVETDAQRDAAEEIARRLPGVSLVINEVVPTGVPADVDAGRRRGYPILPVQWRANGGWGHWPWN